MSRKTRAPDDAEYRLFVFSRYKDTEQEYRTVVVLQTTEEFASFRYELSVDEEITDREIRYTVTGLTAPRLSLPGSGPALFRREYRNFHGTYRITVEGLDRISNSFEFEIGEKQVHLLRSPSRPFVVVSTDHHSLPDFP